MAYKSLEDALIDLERNGQLVRIREEVDPYLEMASIHLRVFEKEGPALLFENVKGSKFRACSNLFGTLERSRFLFRGQLDQVKQLIDLKIDPASILKNPLKKLPLIRSAFHALPKKVNNGPVLEQECNISDIPQIVNWPMDGGPFVTMPIVYTENALKPGVMQSNIGMYRIQLGGNEYITNKEIGLHYQLHRGIGVHQSISNSLGKPLKVSVFAGGPPSLPFSAVMPLPEGMAEVTFAGVLGGRRFRYGYRDGFGIATEADFVITGEVFPGETKPEGPFGDHLGYYSLTHPFPLMKVKKVYHRKNAIWPFTVVGRPPQEDTQFGAMIHEITGKAIPSEIPGLKEVHAVDAAGVHPLLLAIGSERYTPYLNDRKPSEILTIANHILGSGQLSLAKFLFICAGEDNPDLDTHHLEAYFLHFLERFNPETDLHFYTHTSIDTLDYSGTGLNEGSKVVLAAAGLKRRTLSRNYESVSSGGLLEGVSLVMPGILSIQTRKFSSYEENESFIEALVEQIKRDIPAEILKGFPIITLCDDHRFVSAQIKNWLWVSFTRTNPSHDIHGVDASVSHKHWGCKGPVILDARKKPHHAPDLILDPAVEKRVDRLGEQGGSLYGII